MVPVRCLMKDAGDVSGEAAAPNGAAEELASADLIAERINQLGGEPDFAPDTLKLLDLLQGETFLNPYY